MIRPEDYHLLPFGRPLNPDQEVDAQRYYRVLGDTMIETRKKAQQSLLQFMHRLERLQRARPVDV